MLLVVDIDDGRSKKGRNIRNMRDLSRQYQSFIFG